MRTDRNWPQMNQTRDHSTLTCLLTAQEIATKYTKVAVMMSHKMIQLIDTAGFRKLSISNDSIALVGGQADRHTDRLKKTNLTKQPILS